MTAIGGIDFEETSTEYSISGTSSVSAPVNIMNDLEIEGSEGFNVTLVVGAGFAGVANVSFNPNQATSEIIDGTYNYMITILTIKDALAQYEELLNLE